MRCLLLVLTLVLALPVFAKKNDTRIDLGGSRAKIAKPPSRPPKVKSGMLKKPSRKQQKQWEARNKAVRPKTTSEGQTETPPER